MSGSLIITGIVPPDEKYRKMRAVYDACIKAEVDVPNDVLEFFNYCAPLDIGTAIDIEDKQGIIEKIDKYGDYAKTINLDALSKKHPSVKFIKVHYSY